MTPIPRGRLQIHGADVLAVARNLWTSSVSLNAIAQITNLDPRQTRRFLVPGHAGERLNFATIGLLCWFFGCGIDDLIRYERPDRPAPAREVVLQRHEPPPAYPAPGAVRFIYRIATATEFVPPQVIGERTGWTPTFVRELRGGRQGRGGTHGSVDRSMVHSIEQTTLVKLLGMLHADQLSTLLQVESTLTASAPTPSDPQDVVTIIRDPGLPWRAVVTRWRQLGDVAADQLQAPGVLGIDAAAMRYLYQHHQGSETNASLRIGGQLAEVLQVTRASIQQIISGRRLKEHQPDALPEAVQRFLDQLLVGKPLDTAKVDQ